MPQPSNPNLPLRIAGGKQFELVRDFLARAGYCETEICQTLQVESMSDVRRVRWDSVNLAKVSPGLNLCLQLFLRGASLPVLEVQDGCAEQVLNACFELGLLRPSKTAPGQLVCPVWLYPVDGFWVVSDRPSDPDGQEFVPAEDVVFPAIYGGTLRFLKLLPAAGQQEALDLCGGSGIGALWLSRTATAAFTSDITERSAWYATFNARLNGAAVTSLCGDLYDPVAGHTFSVITAHPPFVPAVGQTMVYRDGGESGEDITRRVIEGLPEFLRPGGTCVVLCVGRDTLESPFEHRVREWLGKAAGEFDVLFGLEKILSVEEVIDSMRKRGRTFDEAQAKELMDRLRSSQTKQFVYGALYLRRASSLPFQPLHDSQLSTLNSQLASGVPALAGLPPLRLHLSPDGCAADFERVLDWRCRRSLPGFHDLLACSKPRLNPGMILTARHVVHEGQLVPAEFIFSIQAGLEAALRPDAWVVPILARLQGGRSVREIFDEAASAGELPAGFPFEQFRELVSLMIERSLLLV